MIQPRWDKDVLTMDDYRTIQRALRDGKSVRHIVSEFQHSRNTIGTILKQAEPKRFLPTKN